MVSIVDLDNVTAGLRTGERWRVEWLKIQITDFARAHVGLNKYFKPIGNGRHTYKKSDVQISFH